MSGSRRSSGPAATDTQGARRGDPQRNEGHPDGPLARCLDPHDLCAAKLVHGEAKDLEFVDALVGAGLIDPASLVRVCKKLPVSEARRDITIRRAQAFLPT